MKFVRTILNPRLPKQNSPRKTAEQMEAEQWQAVRKPARPGLGSGQKTEKATEAK